jgi:hypothetical protein
MTEHPEVVAWQEMRDYVVGLLMLDDEWLVDREQGLDWYASELLLEIDVVGAGHYEQGGDNWLKLKSSIKLGVVPDYAGSELARILNADFALGAFVYEDSVLRLQSTFVFNPLNRGLMRHFAIQVLAQATVATLLVRNLESDLLTEVAHAAHPAFGVRVGEDEILGVYYNVPFVSPDGESLESAIDEVRNGILDERLLNDWIPGFVDEDIRFYQNGAFAFGIGVLPDSPEFKRFGPGILIDVMSMRRRMPLDDMELNQLNLALGEAAMVSQFGPLRLVDSWEVVGESSTNANLFAQLPHASLTHLSNNPKAMMVQIINFTSHAIGPFAFLEDMWGSSDSRLD